MSLTAGHKPPRRRLFLALYPLLAQRRRLANVVKEHCPELNAGGAGAVPCDNLHITLVFLGSVTAETQACIEQVAASVVMPAFSLRLDRLGYWPRKRMLWAMPDPMALPGALSALVESLYRGLASCDVSLEQRAYRPHVTMARKLARGPRGGHIEAVEWTLNEFALMESVSTPEGVRYPLLRSWPLTGA